MSGWRRAHSWADTRLPWIAPSPNLPTAASAVAYGATVFVEATTISEGRGTALPFELLGAPHINSSSLARELNGVETAARAARWRAAYFTPSWWKYNNSVCDGVQYVRPDRARLFADGVALLGALRAFGFEWDGSWLGQPGPQLVDKYAGTPRLREMLDAGRPAAEVSAAFEAEASRFEQSRRPYLLYN